jgi:hypothetical protein
LRFSGASILLTPHPMSNTTHETEPRRLPVPSRTICIIVGIIFH